MLKTATYHYANLLVMRAGIREAESEGFAVRQIVLIDQLKESFEGLVVFEYEEAEDEK